WVWAMSAPGKATEGWDWARRSTVEKAVEATAPAVLHGLSGAPLAGGFPSAAVSERTDWMRASTWLGCMAGWSFGFRGDGTAVRGPWRRVGGSDGSEAMVAAGGRG